MGRYKKLKEEIQELKERIRALERLSKANSFTFAAVLTFPQFVREMEKIISRNNLDVSNKKGG